MFVNLTPGARHILAGAVLGLLSTTLAGTVSAQPARVGLVIGNGAYATLPPAPACPGAARAVADALRSAGYTVVERTNATSGDFGAALGEFANRLTAAPDATAFVYVCTRAIGFNNRPFLLPVKATLARPADVLTEGVLAKAFYDIMARGKARTAIVALDIMPLPSDPKPAGFDAIADAATVEGLGAITIVDSQEGDAITPLARVLTSALAGRSLETAALVSTVSQQLAGTPTRTVAAARMPKAAGYIVGEPPRAAVQPTPPAAPPPPPPVAAPAPAPPPPPVATPAPAPPPPPVATPAPVPPPPPPVATPAPVPPPPPPVATPAPAPPPPPVATPAPAPSPPPATTHAPVPPPPSAAVPLPPPPSVATKPAPTPPPPPAAVPPPAPPPVTTKPAPAPPPPPPAAAPAPALPPPPTALSAVEARMSRNERRAAQESLRRLGYYAGKVDGEFRTDTRVAIRRYQREIGEETTGHLTADQIKRLAHRWR